MSVSWKILSQWYEKYLLRQGPEQRKFKSNQKLIAYFYSALLS